MDTKYAVSPAQAAAFDTEQLRQHFLLGSLMQAGEVRLAYSFDDRMIAGGAQPGSQALALPNPPELRAAFFLERREIGIINLGGAGTVVADGQAFELEKLDGLYLGRGTRDVSFQSADAAQPACFYLLSAPAHASYPNARCSRQQAAPVVLGTALTSNARTVYKYIHLDGLQSCQLVMGLTVLEPGSVWNSVPPHIHPRRTEVYFYFDVPEEQRVFHFMGQPAQTRHLVVANHEAVLSPPWSTHFGCGTTHYGFVWGMCGENLEYTDMDPAPLATLR